MEFLQQYLTEIEDALGKLDFPEKPGNLYNPCRYILSLGGKRIRPSLTLMAHRLFNANYAMAIPASLCVELFHNFSLIHDDIMDKAPLRRGKPTVHTKWNDSVGILSGDAMLVFTYKILAENYTGETLSRLFHLYNTTALQVCEGQQMDMDFELREDVAVAEYEEMISLKTSVLLGCALQMGAITAGASNHDAQLLYAFGKNLGIAFQLRDDYLDAFGDVQKTGKQNGGDILAGKKTFLVLKCLELSSESEKKILLEQLHSNHAAKIEKTLALFHKWDVEVLIKQEIEKFQNKAMQCIQEVQVPEKNKQELVYLANYLLNREH